MRFARGRPAEGLEPVLQKSRCFLCLPLRDLGGEPALVDFRVPLDVTVPDTAGFLHANFHPRRVVELRDTPGVFYAEKNFFESLLSSSEWNPFFQPTTARSSRVTVFRSSADSNPTAWT